MKCPVPLAAWLCVLVGLAAATTAEAACTRGEVSAAQLGLRYAGYDPGPIDGKLGPKTRAAIKKWQKAGKLEPHGLLACEDRPRPKRPKAAPPKQQQNAAKSGSSPTRKKKGETYVTAADRPRPFRYDGGMYQGDAADARPDGFGRIEWPDGRSYTGDWRAGRRHGRGVLVFPDGRIYMGAFEDDRFNGHGMLTFPDGAVYSGAFRAGAFEGEGLYRFPDGDAYRGAFRDGRPNGEGRLNGARTSWRGVWSDGCLFASDGPIAVLVSPESCAR